MKSELIQLVCLDEWSLIVTERRRLTKETTEMLIKLHLGIFGDIDLC